MSDKFEGLKAAALAATPGPWEYREESFDYSIRQAGSTIKYQGCEEYTPIAGDVTGERTAVFIAAASPDVVLCLLAELEEARNTLKNVTECWNDEYQRNKELKTAPEEKNQRIEALHQQAVKDGNRIVELEQRLQQPIKLPEHDTNDYGYKSFSVDEVVAGLKEQGFKVEGE